MMDSCAGKCFKHCDRRVGPHRLGRRPCSRRSQDEIRRGEGNGAYQQYGHIGAGIRIVRVEQDDGVGAGGPEGNLPARSAGRKRGLGPQERKGLVPVFSGSRIDGADVDFVASGFGEDDDRIASFEDAPGPKLVAS
jgi:hypothetical protein